MREREGRVKNFKERAVGAMSKTRKSCCKNFRLISLKARIRAYSSRPGEYFITLKYFSRLKEEVAIGSVDLIRYILEISPDPVFLIDLNGHDAE